MADSKLLSLTEIFNQKFFRIPDFQRGYSWEQPQLEDFWEDIQNLKQDKVHYTGLLTVESINRDKIEKIEKWQDDVWLLNKGLTAYYIIDGQQRLTTSIIFINELLKRFNDIEGINYDSKEAWVSRFLYKQYGENYKSFIFGYEKDNPSDEYFKTKILEQQSSSSDKVPEQTLYTYNLKFAKNYFEGKFKNIENSALEELFKKVVNKLRFNFYEIDDELDVYVTFETMNNRGKSLSNLELLKNRLIYLSTLLNDNIDTRTRLRKDINEVWKTIYEYLGKNKAKPLNDDDFLKNHWIMYFDNYERSEAEVYAKFLLLKKFTAKNVFNEALNLKEIKDYIDSLGECVKAWFYLFNVEYSTYKEETKEWIQKLDRLGMGSFSPLLMAAMTKEKDESKLLELFKAVEQFIFLVFQVSQCRSNTGDSHFYRLAYKYYSHVIANLLINLEYVINDIRANTQGWVEIEGDPDNVTPTGYFDLERFHQYIIELAKKDVGYYSWNGLRYFLYEYELHLQERANNNQKVSWVDFNKRKKEDTIEHIYPQTPNDACWTEAFKDHDKKQQKALLHSLGNLVLLAREKNSELQNKCFAFKKKHKKIYKDKTEDYVGYFKGSYSEIEVATYSQWTGKEIIDRGKKMLEFMEERWGFNQDGGFDWGITKEELLNIDFITVEEE